MIWCVMSEVAPGLLLRNCGACVAALAEICSEQSMSCVFVLPEIGWVSTEVSAVQISFWCCGHFYEAMVGQEVHKCVTFK